jgi:hypothetical protein
LPLWSALYPQQTVFELWIKHHTPACDFHSTKSQNWARLAHNGMKFVQWELGDESDWVRYIPPSYSSVDDFKIQFLYESFMWPVCRWTWDLCAFLSLCGSSWSYTHDDRCTYFVALPLSSFHFLFSLFSWAWAYTCLTKVKNL